MEALARPMICKIDKEEIWQKCGNLVITNQIMAEMWSGAWLIRSLRLIRLTKLVIYVENIKKLFEQNKETGNVKNCIGRRR